MTLNIRRRTASPVAEAALEAAQIPPVLAKLYAARGITAPDAVAHKLAALPSPTLLKGIAEAVTRLHTAIENHERICIIADYDADGATACAVAVRGLRALGANVDYLVPNRFEFGYGLTPEIVALAAAEKTPHLLVTVDNGIASVDGAAAAKARGIDVLVTDHHLPAAELPDAIIVNPNQPGCTFPTKALAGVGVLFYVLMALRKHRNAESVNLAQWLDIVAVGTVADVVPLDAVNRILVEQGVRRMRAGQACAGVRALFEIAGRDIRNTCSTDLGFVIGPRINAAGRLSDISLGIECLITDDASRAHEIAAELDGLNRERREIESGMRDEAVTRALAQLDAQRVSVCVYDETWHQGVVGIVAGRIKDATHRPTIVFAPGNEEGVLRGSGRSIPGFHLRDALDLVSKRHPAMMDKFGGHAMAAGLSLRSDQLPAFTDAFEAVARAGLTPEQLERVYLTDGEFPTPQVSLAQADALRNAVWGQAFPEPTFDEIVTVLERKIVGGKHLKLRVQRAGGGIVTALMWNETETPKNDFNVPSAQIQVVFRWAVNSFQGVSSVEMMIQAWSAAQ